MVLDVQVGGLVGVDGGRAKGRTGGGALERYAALLGHGRGQ